MKRFIETGGSFSTEYLENVCSTSDQADAAKRMITRMAQGSDDAELLMTALGLVTDSGRDD